MSRIIFVLSLATAGFFGFTLWQDPTTGPFIRSYIPEAAMPYISDTQSAELGTGGAAARVAGSVTNAVNN